MKFLPKRQKMKKVKKKLKTKRNQKELKCAHIPLKNNLVFHESEERISITERSLHIEFDSELEQDRVNLFQFTVETPNKNDDKVQESKDFCQMAEILSFKREKKVKEVGIETSNKVMHSYNYNIVD